MKKFVCRACSRSHAVWAARCSGCRSLEGLVVVEADVVVAQAPDPQGTVPAEADVERPRSFVRVPSVPEPSLEDPATELIDVMPIPIADVLETSFVRMSTGLAPVDGVLGGGLVEASAILLSSAPGSGKTSLTLQVLNGLGHCCLYVTGEETVGQIAATARRINAASRQVYIVAETDLVKIFAMARALRARTIAIDSIQKMHSSDLDSRPGTPGQLKECTARLVKYAKDTGTAMWIIGQVTGDGSIAGPKALEHEVDAVLELAEGPDNQRILRFIGKHRFGPTNVVGRFSLTAEGLVPIDEDGWNGAL